MRGPVKFRDDSDGRWIRQQQCDGTLSGDRRDHGANIGTTITGWRGFEDWEIRLPLLGFAAFFFFSKSDRWRYWAMAIMGVGMVFFGLELMKDACAIIKEPLNLKVHSNTSLLIPISVYSSVH